MASQRKNSDQQTDRLRERERVGKKGDETKVWPKNQEEVLGGIVLALAEDDELDDDGVVVVAGVATEEVAAEEEEVLDRALFLLSAPAELPVELGVAVAAAGDGDEDDAAQRLLLYVNLLGGRAQLVHAFPGLVRDVVEGLFRLGEDLVRAGRGRRGQFFDLRVELSYHPLEALPALARVRADVLREHILHVPVQRNALHLDGGLLLEQRLARVRRMRNVAERFVHRQEAAKGQVDRLERHQPLARIHRGLLAGVAHVRRSDQLLGPLGKVPLGADEAVRVQDTVHDAPLDDVGADDGRVDRVGVLAPGRLGHGFPRVVEYVL